MDALADVLVDVLVVALHVLSHVFIHASWYYTRLMYYTRCVVSHVIIIILQGIVATS